MASLQAKRPRLSSILLSNDDSEICEEEQRRWREQLDALLAAHTLYEDPDFPATHVSVRGKEESTPSAPAPPPAPIRPGERPKCSCGAEAAEATVSKDTPNKGRKYYHCPSRKCGFFAWADGGEVAFRRGGTAAQLAWARLPHELNIVDDYGFRAEDLRQGGVGDCWFVYPAHACMPICGTLMNSCACIMLARTGRFMSALAVVAERHDLIAKVSGAFFCFGGGFA